MKKHYIIAATLGIILIALDQFTKYWAFTEFVYTDKAYVGSVQFSRFLKLTYSENPGMAFGIPLPLILLIFINLLLLGIIIFFAKKELNLKKILTVFLLTLILAGGISNLIDRILNGYVVDFIAIWKWPTFNLADIYITVGILLMIVFYGKIKHT